MAIIAAHSVVHSSDHSIPSVLFWWMTPLTPPQPALGTPIGPKTCTQTRGTTVCVALLVTSPAVLVLWSAADQVTEPWTQDIVKHLYCRYHGKYYTKVRRRSPLGHAGEGTLQKLFIYRVSLWCLYFLTVWCVSFLL